MTPKSRLRTLLEIILSILAVSAAVGFGISMSQQADDSHRLALLIGTGQGVLIGAGITLIEFTVFSNTRLRAARRVPQSFLILLRAAAHCGVIFIGLTLPSFVMGSTSPWAAPGFLNAFVLSAIVTFLVSTGIEIIRLLGPEAVTSLITGRYDRPRLEHRVVMFADVIGSTRIAEDLGELRFHQFLGEIAQDLAPPIESARGHVHRYVGDAVIVTWPLKRGMQRGACLYCAHWMQRALADNAPKYQARFGHVPQMRIAIHAGQVAAGGIGDWKREIALLGDTMNTTARIETAARHFGERVVLSDQTVSALPDTATTALRRLPPFAAAGKGEPLTLWAADPG